MRTKTFKFLIFSLFLLAIAGSSYASAVNLNGYYIPNNTYFVWKSTYESGALGYLEQKTTSVNTDGQLIVDQEIYNASGAVKSLQTTTTMIESIITVVAYDGVMEERSVFVAGKQIVVYVILEFYGEKWVDQGTGAIVKQSGKQGEDPFVTDLISWKNEDLKGLYSGASGGDTTGGDDLDGYSSGIMIGLSIVASIFLLKRKQ